MGQAWVDAVRNDESYYVACVEAKNRARSRAHLDKGVERRLELHELCVRMQELYGEEDVAYSVDDVKRLLGSLLAQFRSDDSLVVLMRGLARHFELQMPASESLVLQVAADALAERSDAVKSALTQCLCSVAKYSSAPSDAHLRWSTKPAVSNRTLAQLARSIKEAIAAKGLDVAVGANDGSTLSTLSQWPGPGQAPLRLNVDGVKDRC
jgi:hypothetical protein